LIIARVIEQDSAAIATEVLLPSLDGTLDLTANECQKLKCNVEFDVSCPRTGAKGPKDRWMCNCGGGSACIDE
jgi:hypothetical protein